VPAPTSFDYAILRVVPRVERQEFINVGVILYCLQRDFLEARVSLDRDRLVALAPEVDVALVESHLATIPQICIGGVAAGPLGALSDKERFHWLVAPKSAIVQTSPVHSGMCRDPEAMLEHLMRTMVLPTRQAGVR
jgi:hypothetical protein